MTTMTTTMIMMIMMITTILVIQLLLNLGSSISHEIWTRIFPFHLTATCSPPCTGTHQICSAPNTCSCTTGWQPFPACNSRKWTNVQSTLHYFENLFSPFEQWIAYRVKYSGNILNSGLYFADMAFQVRYRTDVSLDASYLLSFVRLSVC